MDETDLMAVSLLFAAFVKDVVAWEKGLLTPLSNDLRQLEELINEKGISFVMIDMPDACRVLDKSISSCRLSYVKLPESFWRVDQEGFFLDSLFAKVFDQSGDLIPHDSETAIFFLRTALCLFKKVKIRSTDESVLSEVTTFRKIDASLRSPTFSWSSDDLGFEPNRVSLTDGYRSQSDLASQRDDCPLPLLRAAEAVSDIVFGQFPELDWRDIRPRHGPGAVADAKYGTDKYLFPNWPVKLNRTFPIEYFTQSREDLHLEESNPLRVCLVEPPARLLAVPKTLKAPRMIASEPIAHQFIQLGLMRWIRDNMPRSIANSIDFRDQTVSQTACLQASLDGRSATVDLSAASDHLSCWLVERMGRRNPSLLSALHACRTRWLVNATGIGEPYFIELKKFGAMGAGTTFPLQTICYTILAIACLLYENGSKITSKTIFKASKAVRVFGDDIILPSPAVWSLVLLLTHLGLKVNPMKTHWTGRFRESCGIDAYNGVDVTPLYLSSLTLKDNAESLASWVDVSNNAYSKGLWSLADAMTRMIPDDIQEFLPVSPISLGCLSLLTYLPSVRSCYWRYSSSLHRDEVRGITVTTKVRRRRRETYVDLLQRFVEEPLAELPWTAGYDVKKRSLLKKRWVPLYG